MFIRFVRFLCYYIHNSIVIMIAILKTVL